jgi:hypothetical protein
MNNLAWIIIAILGSWAVLASWCCWQYRVWFRSRGRSCKQIQAHYEYFLERCEENDPHCWGVFDIYRDKTKEKVDEILWLQGLGDVPEKYKQHV